MFSLIHIVKQKIHPWYSQFRLRFFDTWLALPFFPARHLLPVQRAVARQLRLSEHKAFRRDHS